MVLWTPAGVLTQGSGPPPLLRLTKKKKKLTHTNRGQESTLFVFCYFLSLPCSVSSNVCNSLLYTPFHMRKRRDCECVCDCVHMLVHRECRCASALGAERRRRRRRRWSFDLRELNSYLTSSQSGALLRLTKNRGARPGLTTTLQL